MNRTTEQRSSVWLITGLVLAPLLWWLMFTVRPFNFWVMMCFSTCLLTGIAWVGAGNPLRGERVTAGQLGWGLLAALALYGVFWLGNACLAWLQSRLTWWPIDRQADLGAVYAGRHLVPGPLLAALLACPIAFGEEVFWRGFLQRQLAERWGHPCGFLAACGAYTAVHLVTGNLLLVIASLVCGCCWGLMFWRQGRLLPSLFSHMIWSPVIFVIFPLTQG